MKTTLTLAACTLAAVTGTPLFCDRKELMIENGICHSHLLTGLGKTGEIEHRHTLNYVDGVATMVTDKPNARKVSQEIMQASKPREQNSKGTNLLFIYFGQFIDHDITLVESTEGTALEEHVDIDVEDGDLGTNKIPFTRSTWRAASGEPRGFPNSNTGWLDLSNIYGDTKARSDKLRRLDGSGKLKTTTGPDGQEMLPFNRDVGVDTAMDNGSNSLFACGDTRCNEHAVLISFTLLFVREHNRLAEIYLASNPSATEEQVYDNARLMNVHQYQQIIYEEWLPTLLGPLSYSRFLPPYRRYNPRAQATGVLEFSTAAFRFGHSGISDFITRVDKNGVQVKRNHIVEVFFTTKMFRDEEYSLDYIMNGLRSTMHEEIDNEIVDSLRNHLFRGASPGHPPLDLAALNIQRSRDHGLGSFNELRKALGLPVVNSIANLTFNFKLGRKLTRLYGGSIDNIDLWVAGLCEDQVADSHLGETFATSVGKHFAALRDGDRFFYLHFEGPQPNQPIGTISLNDIISRNAKQAHGWGENAFSANKQSARPPSNKKQEDKLNIAAVAGGLAGAGVVVAIGAVVYKRKSRVSHSVPSKVDPVLESHRVVESDKLATIEDC